MYTSRVKVHVSPDRIEMFTRALQRTLAHRLNLQTTITIKDREDGSTDPSQHAVIQHRRKLRPDEASAIFAFIDAWSELDHL